uniref:Intracellular alkaline serine protease n=1 Tax=uncultured marine group II/III euryarchaeote KM3_135_H05 TaxID=1457866 RepID=A0A075G975_9EURY|nr:intracellular alkaline serine protease [uncultured marine group II/III euryarchaeote KM3_135_H05]
MKDYAQFACSMDTKVLNALLCAFLVIPLAGSIAPPTVMTLDEQGLLLIEEGQTTLVPAQAPVTWANPGPWWSWTSLDADRNGVHDSLQVASGPVNIGLSYERAITDSNRNALALLGHEIHLELPVVNALLIGAVDASEVQTLAQLDGVVMVERYGSLVFYGDIQTPAVKARNSTEYPIGAWDLGVSGEGVNIALTDTGVDNEHPGLSSKFVAGYDAVCYMHTDPQCLLAGGREEDGSFDPDDGNQHGTACMGMASATGIEADGSQSNYYGSAPNASLVDVRIGTDVGAGPFENYLLEQEFYESAMNGLQWIIDHRDDAWAGVDEANHGIDIISLSWGITSHENGGSDGTDMHSRILDDAMLAGVTVSNAAGNDGPDNDGLSGMSASSLSVTVAATDDLNTVDRSDDTIASYSSRGPRKDNGDGNPLNELVPELSAPGTNIVQAEGCVTSGGCNNFLGGDASDNTYTGRGSGTSYATPAVTGVIALVIEANGNLTPLQIKEVLKQTAERRGEPSAPEVDPYWNRDFGWGMVDAHAAVSLALHLAETEQTELMNPSLQNHLLNLIDSNGTINVTGHSWGQLGSIERVEYRIDGGDWAETIYSAEPGEIGALTPFMWHVIMNPEKLSEGAHEIEVRAVSGEGNSLPVLVTVHGSGSEGNGFSVPPMVILGIASVFAIWVASLALLRFRSDGEIDSLLSNLRRKEENSAIEEVLDAEIVDEEAID